MATYSPSLPRDDSHLCIDDLIVFKPGKSLKGHRLDKLRLPDLDFSMLHYIYLSYFITLLPSCVEI